VPVQSRQNLRSTLLRAETSEVKIMKFDHTVETSAPPEKIWAAWTDVERWPEWDTELDSASLDGSFALGAKGRVKPKRGPAARFSISELIPGESYTFTTRLPLCGLKVRRHLTRKDGGATYFTHEVSFVGPLSCVFGNLLGGRYREALPVVMENLRKTAEG
jgi:uncharacterized protein YndB with AHSA1/START domain